MSKIIRPFSFALAALSALALLMGCHKDVSGSYLVNDNTAVCWLTLVKTGENTLSGQLVSSVLKPDGTIERGSVTLNGAIGGDTVTLNGGGLFGVGTTTLSGTVEGNRLNLIGVETVPVTLTRSTEGEYQAKLKSLVSSSQAILTARAAAQAQQSLHQEQSRFVEQLHDLVSRMDHFDNEADVRFPRFQTAEQRYAVITSNVSKYVARERELARNPMASGVRGQLSNAANQASLSADQMDMQAEALQASLETNIKPLSERLVTMRQQCGVITKTMDIDSACNKLAAATPVFQTKLKQTSDALTQLRETYRREKAKQQEMLASAD